jgi:hypothetical protein
MTTEQRVYQLEEENRKLKEELELIERQTDGWVTVNGEALPVDEYAMRLLYDVE